MNHKRFCVLLLAMIIAVSASAQFASFRNLSTAGILDGDIEYILVPGEMSMVDGFNIYSNLSNFDDLSENVFSGVSSQNYLIGGKGNFGMIQLGVLHRSNNYGYAYIDTFFNTVHTDTDGNLEYDRLDYTEEFNNYDYIRHNDETYFGFAFGDKETTNFGIGYKRYNSTHDDLWTDTISNETSNLITGVVNYRDVEYDSYQEIYGDVWNEYVLSIYQPMNTMGIGLNIFFAPTRYSYDWTECDTTYQNFAPGGTVIDYYATDYTYDEEYKYNYTRWGADMLLRNETEEYIGEAFAYYSNHKTGDSESYFEDEVIRDARSYPGIVENLTWDSYEHNTTLATTPSVYSYAAQNFSGGMKYIKKLNKVLFGMGAVYALSTNTYAIDAYYEYDYTYNYNNGDGVLDANDYTITEHAEYQFEELYAYLHHQVDLPVGVEFDAWKNVKMRLGARTSFRWSNYYYSERWVDYDGGTGTIAYEDGTTAEYLLENPIDRDDYTRQGTGFDKYTTYSYGIGWTISENMYVDFMGFSNLVDLTGWKVSANVKFL